MHTIDKNSDVKENTTESKNDQYKYKSTYTYETHKVIQLTNKLKILYVYYSEN